MKVPSVKVNFCSCNEIARLYNVSIDPLYITQKISTCPTSLAGKLVKFISRKDEIDFLTSSLSTISVQSTFKTLAIRVYNSLVAFVNDRTIRSDLVMFDMTASTSYEDFAEFRHKFFHIENGWVIQTKKEDVYIEMCTRLDKTTIPVPLGSRIRNWFTRKGPTSKDIPALKYTVVLKVFNTPGSFYYINLFTFDVDVPYSQDAYLASNFDFELDSPNPPLKARERCDARKVYFR